MHVFYINFNPWIFFFFLLNEQTKSQKGIPQRKKQNNNNNNNNAADYEKLGSGKTLLNAKQNPIQSGD